MKTFTTIEALKAHKPTKKTEYTLTKGSHSIVGSTSRLATKYLYFKTWRTNARGGLEVAVQNGNATVWCVVKGKWEVGTL